MKTTTTILVALLLSGCVTPAVIQKPASAIDFSKFKTVSFVVREDQQTEYGVGDEALHYGKQTISLIRSLLGTRLADMGYQTVELSAPHDFSIDVYVTEVKPGSTAARLLIGFGAGRADTEFKATFADSQGAVLAILAGGRSYTGGEMNVPALPDKSILGTLAATRSVDQLEAFIHNGGALPVSQPAKPRPNNTGVQYR